MGVKHPAVFSDAILETCADILFEQLGEIEHRRKPWKVLDPFAGTGKVHELETRVPGVMTAGVELMPRWAAMHPYTMVGNAARLPRHWLGEFHAVVTSPCYGNRFADCHEASDRCSECKGKGTVRAGALWLSCSKCGGSGLSPRRSYRHDYGDGFFADAPPSENAGAMQWGEQYRDFHALAVREMVRVLKPGGVVVLNVKDHVRNGEPQGVPVWWLAELRRAGLAHVETWSIPLNGMRYGANSKARVDVEKIFVMRKFP